MTMTGTTIGAIIVAVTSLIGTIYTTYKSWQTNRRPQVIDANRAQNEGWQALMDQYQQQLDQHRDRIETLERDKADTHARLQASENELDRLRAERTQDRAWMRQAVRYIYQLQDRLRERGEDIPQPEFNLDW